MIRVIMMMIMALMVGVAMGSIVDETCKQTFDYTFCLSLFRSDPRSSSADITGLSLILVDKVKALGVETLGQINQAYKTKPMLKRPLDECNRGYKYIVNVDVQDAISAIKGDPKFAPDPFIDADFKSSDCEKGFPKGQSSLTSLTQRMDKICDVADVIVRMLL